MILDTNALSAWGDRDHSVLDILPESYAIEIPVIVVGEYLWGLRRSRDKIALEEWLTKVIGATRLLAITFATAEAYADVREGLRLKGRPIPSNDTWIAAMALEHDLPIISRDAHFDAVDGITRISW